MMLEIEMDETTTARGARKPGALERLTGRDRYGWFELLDEWGAAGRPYRETADWLTGEHGLSDWWAQKLIVEYEEARGIRPPGVRRDGTFQVGASKVIAASADRVRAAFVEDSVRERWLPGAVITERQPSTSDRLRFEWGDGSRIVVELVADGQKTQVAVQHERLGDADTAAKMKVYWRDRLAALKTVIEGSADR